MTEVYNPQSGVLYLYVVPGRQEAGCSNIPKSIQRHALNIITMTGTCLNQICSLCFDDLSPPSMFFFSPNINVFTF